MTHRIADDPGDYTHSDAVTFFGSLLIDLKVQLLGKTPSEPITEERLEQGSKHIKDLMQCRTPWKVY